MIIIATLVTTENKNGEVNNLQNLTEAKLHGKEEMIREIRDSLAVTKKGKVLDSSDNYQIIMRNDPILKGSIGFNELEGKVELLKDLWSSKAGNQLKNSDEYRLNWYIETYYGISNEKKIRETMLIIAEENGFHPIKAFLEGLVWDGVERIDTLLTKYLGVENSPYVCEVMHLLMQAMIHRIYVPGAKYDLMVCLVGSQGAGKSSFLRLLTGNDKWFSDDLRKFDDEKVYQKLAGHWLLEISEMLATGNAKNVEEIKSFLSKTAESYRIPYDRHSEDRPRQCVFVGTTNNKEFLPHDNSGNRRFLPIQCGVLPVEKHVLEDEEETRAYMAMAWAEAFDIYRKTKKHTLKLSKEMEEKLSEIQEEFTPEDTFKGRLITWLEECKHEYVCYQLIYMELINPYYNKSRVPDEAMKDIRAVMETLTDEWEKGPQHRFGPNIGRQASWRRIKRSGDQKFKTVTSEDQIPFEEKLKFKGQL